MWKEYLKEIILTILTLGIRLLKKKRNELGGDNPKKDKKNGDSSA